MKQLILFITLLPYFAAFGQNPGYFGKTNILEVNTIFNIPLFPNLIGDKLYSYDNGQYQKKNDLLDYGFQFGYFHNFSKKFALGMRVDHKYYSAGVRSYYTPVGSNERFEASNWHFVPTVSFTMKGGVLPIGISHEIGAGYKIDKLIEKDYRYSYSVEDLNLQDDVDTSNFQLYNFDNKSFGFVTLNYTIKLRYPIKDWLVLNFGFNYRLTFFQKIKGSNIETEPSYFINRKAAQQGIQSRERWGLAQGFVGVSFPF